MSGAVKCEVSSSKQKHPRGLPPKDIAIIFRWAVTGVGRNFSAIPSSRSQLQEVHHLCNHLFMCEEHVCQKKKRKSTMQPFTHPVSSSTNDINVQPNPTYGTSQNV